MRLTGLILERIRVHRIDEQASGLGERLQLRGALRPVPGNVERDARSDTNQAVDDVAVLKLLEDVARLARSRKQRKTGPPRGHAPRGNSNLEAPGTLGHILDVNRAPRKLSPKMIVIRSQCIQTLCIFLRDE